MLSLIQTTVNQIVLLASLSLVLVYLSMKTFCLLAAIIPISSVVGAVLGRRIKALSAEEREQEGGLLAILAKALGAFRIVRGFELTSRTVESVDHRLGEYLVTSYRRYRLTRLFQAVNELTMLISNVLSMFVGALFVLRGALTFGAYFAFVNAFWRAVTTLMQLFNRVPEFNNLGVILTRIESFIAAPEPLYYHEGSSTSVNKITMSYGGPLILMNLSLDLSPGERVIIVGPNGSGKTTLANILSGYLAPSQGDVILPRRISSVTLPITFPPLKVKDLVSDTRLLSAFNLRGRAVLEAYADALSAGQQQKLAISLALSKEADLYVLDEPLANLDLEGRKAALNLILERTKGKTLVLVMHGAEDCHNLFDRIIGIDSLSYVSDRIVENGIDETLSYRSLPAERGICS